MKLNISMNPFVLREGYYGMRNSVQTTNLFLFSDSLAEEIYFHNTYCLKAEIVEIVLMSQPFPWCSPVFVTSRPTALFVFNKYSHKNNLKLLYRC